MKKFVPFIVILMLLLVFGVAYADVGDNPNGTYFYMRCFTLWDSIGFWAYSPNQNMHMGFALGGTFRSIQVSELVDGEWIEVKNLPENSTPSDPFNLYCYWPYPNYTYEGYIRFSP